MGVFLNDPGFVVGGVDYFPLLSQIVSGEMDADRMDYLQRDSFYWSIHGNSDQTWLENLSHHVEGDRAFLALELRALFAFEDFLLSRYHMFVSVYLHYFIRKPVRRFFEERPMIFAFLQTLMSTFKPMTLPYGLRFELPTTDGRNDRQSTDFSTTCRV